MSSKKEPAIESDVPPLQTPMGTLAVDGDVAVVEIEHEVLEPDDIQRHIDLMLGFSQHRGVVAMPVLMDLGKLRWLGWQARVCAAELTRPEWHEKFAILWHDPVQRVIAAFFLGMNRPPVPSMMFNDRGEALSWLREPAGDDDRVESVEGSPGSRIARTVDTLARIGLGDLCVEPRMSDEPDELDAIDCGLAMLSEELVRIFSERESVEDEARRHRRRLELLVQERTIEVQEINESLKHEIEVRRETEERLRLINEELNSFASTVSHDLKGPLSVIRSAGETLTLVLARDNDPTTDNARDLADIISRNTGKATTLIDELLALAEAGQVPGEVEEIDLGVLVDDVLEECAPRIAGERIRVVVSGDMGCMTASRTQVHQVFSNLLNNMIQHNSSAEPLVEIRALPAPPGVHRFLIRDNGQGVPEDALEKIFEPFFTTADSRTGLGLSTVKKIVEVYDGEVVAFNDSGANFEVTLHDFRP